MEKQKLNEEQEQALRKVDVIGLLPTDYELEGWLMNDCGGASPESALIRDDMRRGAKWMKRAIIEKLYSNIR